MLTFYQYYNSFLVVIFLFFKFYYFNSNIITLIFCFNFNENFINIFYNFWTNFWYLFIFFFIIFVILYFVIYEFKNSNNILIFLFFILYIYEATDFNLINDQIVNLNSSINNFNTFLFNNLNKYHPFLFYLNVLILTHCSSLLVLLIKINNNFNKEFIFYKNFTLIKLSIFFSGNSLFLGSWWALQENNWGGWWNWDSSETFGLFFFVFELLTIHLYFTIKNFIKILFTQFARLTILLIMYFFVQINFDLTSHNFGIKFFYFFNNNFFYIECLAASAVFLINLLKNNLTIINNFKILLKFKILNFNNMQNFKYYNLVTIILFLIISFFSFNLLTNVTSFLFLATNLYNINANWPFYIFLITYFFYIFYTKLRPFYFIFNLILYPSYLFFLNIFLFEILNLYYLVHYIIANFLKTNICNFNINFISYSNTCWVYSNFNQKFLFITKNLYVCDFLFIETSNNFFDTISWYNIGYCLNNATLYSYNNASNCNFFSLLKNNVNFLFKTQFTENLLIENLFLSAISFNTIYFLYWKKLSKMVF